MAQEPLHGMHTDAGLDQVGGERVPKAVDAALTRDAGGRFSERLAGGSRP